MIALKSKRMEKVKVKVYIKRNIIPISIEIVFLISCFIIPSEFFIYTNFIFYLSLLFFFVIRKEFSMREWIGNMKQGRKFWKPVFITVVFFLFAFVITTVLENMFPDFHTGSIGLKRDSWFELVLFAISTIALPPIVEELFYRKSMIFLDSKIYLIVTTIFSMFLYAAEHALSAWGILLAMIWALPLSVSYIKTKNVFVPMTAHFIVNLVGNGADVIYTIIARLGM